MDGAKKQHAVCVPAPIQSHIKAMLKLAKLLHSKGIHITFVNTEFNHQRFLRTGGPNCLDGLPDFHFEAIPDGIPTSDPNATQDMSALSYSIRNNLLAPFQSLLEKIHNSLDDTPSVTSILSDVFMSPFTMEAAIKLGVPVVVSWTVAACAVMGLFQFQNLLDKGYIPLKDEDLTNGYLDTIIDWIPGMKEIRLKDLPTILRITDRNDSVFNLCLESFQTVPKSSANIIHTFDALEPDIVASLSSMFPNLYTIGPQQLLLSGIQSSEEGEYLSSIGYSLWKEEPQCLQWLDTKKPNSVVYVNFGSITIMSPEQLMEFGWGLANSNHHFLWIIRPDLVLGESAVLPPEFEKVIDERGYIASWCPQEEVLKHEAVGGFLTHGGWNSTIESITAGVPMICWPFFADQQTNCKYMCGEWECGMEIDNDVKRDGVEELVRELMEGEKGKRMRDKINEWKKMAETATAPGGSSYLNLEKLVPQLRCVPPNYSGLSSNGTGGVLRSNTKPVQLKK